MRHLLRKLKSSPPGNATFRKDPEKILQDPAMSQGLCGEINELAPKLVTCIILWVHREYSRTGPLRHPSFIRRKNIGSEHPRTSGPAIQTVRQSDLMRFGKLAATGGSVPENDKESLWKIQPFCYDDLIIAVPAPGKGAWAGCTDKSWAWIGRCRRATRSQNEMKRRGLWWHLMKR